MGHRLYALTLNFGFLFTFSLSDVFANALSLYLPGLLILERHPQQLEEFFSLFITFGRRHDADIQPFNFVDLIILDLRKYQLLFDTQRIISSTVEGFAGDTPEVPDAGQGHINQLVEKIVHPFLAKCNHTADRHAFAELEGGN